MRDTLIVLLDPRELAASTWLLVNADGMVSTTSVCTEESLSLVKQDRVVTVLVPAEDVLLLTVNLPSMSRHRLMQALPFALEEQLIDDIETQHIVAGDATDTGDIAVAVVAHEKMQIWLKQLKDWGLQANRMLPVSLAMPWSASSWYVNVTTLCICRSNANIGFAVEEANAADWLSHALTSAVTLPEQLLIYNYTNRALALGALPVLSQEVMRPPESYLPDLAASLANANASTLNLLCHQYAPKRQRLQQTKKMSRLAVSLLAGLFALLLMVPLVSIFILRDKVSDTDAKIATIYHREFPNAKAIVSPKRRMEDKLHQVTAQLGSNRFLLLMSYVGKAMQEAPSVTIKKLQFQQNHLALDINASTADFTTFTDFLTHQSLQVKQQDATVSGTHVHALVEVN